MWQCVLIYRVGSRSSSDISPMGIDRFDARGVFFSFFFFASLMAFFLLRPVHCAQKKCARRVSHCLPRHLQSNLLPTACHTLPAPVASVTREPPPPTVRVHNGQGFYLLSFSFFKKKRAWARGCAEKWVTSPAPLNRWSWRPQGGMRASETWDLFRRERDPAGAEQPTTARSSNVAVASTYCRLKWLPMIQFQVSLELILHHDITHFCCQKYITVECV